MTQWYVIFDSMFFIAIAGALCGGLGLAIRYSQKLKCKQCTICYGLITVERDIAAEVVEDLRVLDARAHNGVAPSVIGGAQTTAGGSGYSLKRPDSFFTVTPRRGALTDKNVSRDNAV